MGSEWVGAISALSGGLLTGLISIVINKIQLKNEREKILLKEKITLEKENLLMLSKHKEELFDSIQKIDFELSLTQFTALREKGITHGDFIEYYNKIYALAFRSRLLVHLYFPKLINGVEEVYRLVYFIWGIQNNFFGDSHDNKSNQKSLLMDFIKKSEEISKCCSEIMYSICER